MSRKRKKINKSFITEAKYNSELLLKLMNSIMCDGKKTIAEKIVYDALDKLQEKSKDEAMKVFNAAINNIKPTVEVRSRRVGGATYQVPVEVRSDRRQALAIRWILDAARNRSEATMLERLSNELVDASQNKGIAIKKREDTLKMAEANRAFSHYRW